MRTTIDASGRLVVPKALRDRLRLTGASEVDVVEHDGVIEIRTTPAAVRIVDTPEGAVAVPIGALPPLTDADVRIALDNTPALTALDTSIVVPALAAWHEAHDSSRRAAAGGSIPAHALLESYAVLTRLPAPHRLDAATASELLGSWFPPSRILELPRDDTGALLARFAAAGVDGGSAYDGIVALTAAVHSETLLTRDARASTTYERLGVPYELID